MTALLEAQNVTRVFGGGLLHKGHTVAVDGVSLAINEDKPSITTIAGESGSGKTTLARLLLAVQWWERPSAAECSSGSRS